MSKQTITVDLEARLSVDDKSARTCLTLLEFYMNAHPDMTIVGHRDEGGGIRLEITSLPAPAERVPPMREELDHA